jgi:hypothetical protein
LLGVEASLVRVSQSGLKIGGGATTGGARGTIAKSARTKLRFESAVRKECAPVPALHCDFLSSLLLKYRASRAPRQSPNYSPAASAEGAGSYGRSTPSDQPELARRASVLSGV